MCAIIDTCNKLGDVPRSREIKMVYEETIKAHALSQLIVDIWVQWSRKGRQCLREELGEELGEGLRGRGNTFPVAFLLDLEAVEHYGSRKKWYNMPITGPLEGERMVRGLLEAIDEDFAEAARKDWSDRVVHTLTIDMAGTVMIPPPV